MMKFVFDLDGCLLWDFGEYESEVFAFTPLVKLVRSLKGQVELIAVTGRLDVPQEVASLFDRVITRPFPVEPEETFMDRYHIWKCQTIADINPIIAYDDNERLVDWLNENGITAILIPAYKR
jgi:hypothetical protein